MEQLFDFFNVFRNLIGLVFTSFFYQVFIKESFIPDIQLFTTAK